MSFWNKNKLPAEYKDMTEDQIAAALAAGKDATAKFEAAENARKAAEAATAAANSKVAAGQDAAARLKKLQEAGIVDENGDPIRQTTDGGGRNNPPPPSGPPTEADWLTDPNGSFQRSVAPLTAVAMHGAIMAAKAEAERFIQSQSPIERRLWNKYHKEISDLVNALSPEQKILPQTWINQFTFVKGMHIADVAKEAQGSGDAFFSETAGSTGGGMPGANDTKKDDQLTEKEIQIAKRMGRTPEQYLAMKKKMQFGPAL